MNRLDREIQTQIATPIHNEFLQIKNYVDCGRKYLEIMNIKRKLFKFKSEEETTKFLLKIVVVTCMLLAVICVITTMNLIFNHVK